MVFAAKWERGEIQGLQRGKIRRTQSSAPRGRYLSSVLQQCDSVSQSHEAYPSGQIVRWWTPISPMVTSLQMTRIVVDLLQQRNIASVYLVTGSSKASIWIMMHSTLVVWVIGVSLRSIHPCGLSTNHHAVARVQRLPQFQRVSVGNIATERHVNVAQILENRIAAISQVRQPSLRGDCFGSNQAERLQRRREARQMRQNFVRCVMLQIQFHNHSTRREARKAAEMGVGKKPHLRLENLGVSGRFKTAVGLEGFNIGTLDARHAKADFEKAVCAG